MDRILSVTTILLISIGAAAEATEDSDDLRFNRASHHAVQARDALVASDRYLRAWLRHADPQSGLIPRNLQHDRDYWNGKDAAADNYAFMVLTAWFTDRSLLHGKMREMLATEQRLTDRRDHLVDAYSFSQQGWYHEQPDLNRMIFESSEYCKDGLMPLTEWIGISPWSERMIQILDSILQHAAVETQFGRIPSENAEVNGEMMQVTSRVYWMTKKDHYLDAACRIADYYLLGAKHPTQNAEVLRLRDHGCELISGLSEVYVACHFARPDKAAAYRQPLHALLDRVLEVGVNEHGMMFDSINPRTGEILTERISDNWGYNYNAFYALYMVDGTQRYRQATRTAMRSLKPHYLEYPWEGWGSDGIADSVEGAINLSRRESVVGVADWIDANLQRMLKIQKPDGVIEGWHGDGNFARTAIMYALWKQQGMSVQPWREDLLLGAVRHDGIVDVSLSADAPWKGTLYFDTPRHQTIMNLPIDYPRINQFPEWFTIDATKTYQIDREAFQQNGRQGAS